MIIESYIGSDMPYKHDCDRCVSLGEYKGMDLYFCQESFGPTVVARYGDDGPDYKSGLYFSDFDEHLGKAKRIAKEKGLLKD